jgi:hypothetical protein
LTPHLLANKPFNIQPNKLIINQRLLPSFFPLFTIQALTPDSLSGMGVFLRRKYSAKA